MADDDDEEKSTITTQNIQEKGKFTKSDYITMEL